MAATVSGNGFVFAASANGQSSPGSADTSQLQNGTVAARVVTNQPQPGILSSLAEFIVDDHGHQSTLHHDPLGSFIIYH